MECFLGFFPGSTPASTAGDALGALPSRLECVFPGATPASPALLLLAAPSLAPATAAAPAAPGICSAAPAPSAAPAGAKRRASSKPSRASCRCRSWLRAKSTAGASQAHHRRSTGASQEQHRSITGASQAHHRRITGASQAHHAQAHHLRAKCSCRIWKLCAPWAGPCLPSSSSAARRVSSTARTCQRFHRIISTPTHRRARDHTCVNTYAHVSYM